jgi:hypothetical protein
MVDPNEYEHPHYRFQATMKTLLAIGLALFLVGCGQDVLVIDADANKVLVHCDGRVSECVRKECQNGTIIVQDELPTNEHRWSAIIKCAPAPLPEHH